MLQIQRTNQFKKDLKKQEKRGKKLQKFIEAFNLLVQEKKLPEKYKNHKLSGNYKDRWECHIEPDCLLIYVLKADTIIFERIGSHSDLFR